MLSNQQKYLHHISIGILLIGALLRLKVYFDNRDFFLDEINLCRNIANRNILDLFLPLEFGQHAPPLFLVLCKWLSQIFGNNEYAFRLLPLIAGLISIILFYKICRHFISGVAILFPFTLFAFSIYFIEYATSAKQYSLDVLICLALVYSALHIKTDKIKFLLFSIVSAISVWLSMPSIFVLAAIGFYFLLKKKKNPKSENLKEYVPIAIYGIFALTSFGLYYFLILNNSLASDSLADFHKQYFIPFPDSKADLLLFFENILSLFRSIVGKTAVPLIISILLFTLGIFSQWKKNASELILLLCPLLFCIAASMLSMYSILIRLTLFLLPFIMILIGIGLEFSILKINTLSKKIVYPIYILLTALLILCLPQRNGLHYFAKPLLKEQSKAALQFIAKHQHKEKPVYILHSAEPAFTYYTSIHDQKISIPSNDHFFSAWDSDFRRKAKQWKNEGHNLVWVFDCHTFGPDLNRIQKEINEAGKIVDEFVDLNGYARLVEL